jgi:hypothetical protein
VGVGVGVGVGVPHGRGTDPEKNCVKQWQMDLPLTAAMGILLAVVKTLFLPPITPSPAYRRGAAKQELP